MGAKPWNPTASALAADTSRADASLDCVRTCSFLLSQDLEGPTKFLQTQGFNGSDFLAATGESLVAELRCTPFAARKLLRARDLFLEVNA